MSYIKPNAIEYIAQQYNTEVSNVQLLGRLQSLSSPIGYQLKFNTSGVFNVKHGDSDTFIRCDAYHPSSIQEISEQTARETLIECSQQSSGTGNETEDATSLWYTVEVFKKAKMELNPFTQFILEMADSGELDGLNYKKGDLVAYNSGSSIKQVSLSDVSKILVVTAMTHFEPVPSHWSQSHLDRTWSKK